MTNFSKMSLSPLEDGPPIYNNTSTSSSSSDGPDQDSTSLSIISIFFLFIYMIGLVGNGIVICLLGFHIKRSPFTTYILNLAVADFGVLLFFGLLLISLITHVESLKRVALIAATFNHNASELLLTAISIDRCVCVLFPIWHRCHRPPHLSTFVCALVWILCCLVLGSLIILFNLEYFADDVFLFPFIAVAILCPPLVTVSTMILLFKVFCKSRQPRRGRLLTIVLLTLLFFLLFAFPLNASITLNYFTSLKYEDLFSYGIFSAILNSSVNPVIYYIVGRKRRGQQRQSLKVILQRAFKDEEEHREEQDTTAHTSL